MKKGTSPKRAWRSPKSSEVRNDYTPAGSLESIELSRAPSQSVEPEPDEQGRVLGTGGRGPPSRPIA